MHRLRLVTQPMRLPIWSRRIGKVVKYSYAGLALIPASFTVASIASYTVLNDRPRARAFALWAWTGWLSLPLSMALFAVAPFAFIFDPVDRLALDYIQRLWAKWTLRPFVTIDVVNEQLVEDLIKDTGRGCIVVSNHRSMLDVFVLFAALGIPLRFVSKKEIFFIPLVGWVMGIIGHVSLTRGDKQSGKSVLENCKYYLKNGHSWSVVFFAEGSRNTSEDESHLNEFKIGAFKLAESVDAPIVPISIRGTSEAMPPGKEMSFLQDLAKVRVTIHEPIRVNGKEAEKLKSECWQEIKLGLSGS